MYQKTISVIIAAIISLYLPAEEADYSKMSSYVRSVALRANSSHRMPKASPGRSVLSAFVRIDGNADSTLAAYGCRSLARFGNIHIAEIPLTELCSLSLSSNVTRIEAGRCCSATVDVAAQAVNALPAYEGRSLPQAYTGRGVVVGIMDVGFDLTHPNFYDSAAENYRIKRLWDQLSADTVGSGMYVGAEYTTQEQLLGYAHSRDGLKMSHGTHTLGIAAGSGYDSPYRGLAYGSDICLVANAVTEDLEFIEAEDLYKYTYATDALGFKYIFDYAEAQGKPCVISFSEGSHQDFRGDDLLYYEVLDSLVGPGRIIVSSAGNDGYFKTYIHKPAGRASAGTIIFTDNGRAAFTVKSDKSCRVRFVYYGDAGNDTLNINTASVTAREDSMLTDTVYFAGRTCVADMSAYASCYNAEENVCDISLTGLSASINMIFFSVELLGEDTDAELYLMSGYLTDSNDKPHLCDGEQNHSVYSPASAPSVICVGSTVYRTSTTNYLGDVLNFVDKEPGERVDYSAAGPTFDGRVKPDVMAPGSNVISSYSSYFREANPDAADVTSDIAYFDFNGRTYLWSSSAGTSMASPVVGGIVALWLEAKPDLTPREVLGVIERTARKLDNEQPVPNNLWGYGEIDAYRGLLDILGTDGIEGFPKNHLQGVSVIPCGRGQLKLRFSSIPAVPLTLRIHTAGGTLVATKSIHADSEEMTVDVPIQPGRIYAVSLSANDERFCGSTLVRTD